jgi:hypothetical protein
MDSEPEEPSWERAKGLDQRVLSTLLGFHGRIAFNGLRRVLHAHPESLSRSLRRLEREGRIERSSDGYRAVDGGPNRASQGSSGLRPIAQVDLPPGTVPHSVLGRLSGRWFGSLRWVGVVNGGSNDGLLAWARRDGAGHVLLGIHGGVLRVYVRGDDSGDDDIDAEDSAYELLTHAIDALRPPSQRPSDSVSFLAAGWDGRDSMVDD